MREVGSDDPKNWIRVRTHAGATSQLEIGWEGALGEAIDLDRDRRHELTVFQGTSAFAAYHSIVAFRDGRLRELRGGLMEGLLSPSLRNSPPRYDKAWTWGCFDRRDDDHPEIYDAYAYRAGGSRSVTRTINVLAIRGGRIETICKDERPVNRSTPLDSGEWGGVILDILDDEARTVRCE